MAHSWWTGNSSLAGRMNHLNHVSNFWVPLRNKCLCMSIFHWHWPSCSNIKHLAETDNFNAQPEQLLFFLLQNSDTGQRCPVDNAVLSEDQLFPDNFAKREILSLTVRCPNSGCAEKMELRHLEVRILWVTAISDSECSNQEHGNQKL